MAHAVWALCIPDVEFSRCVYAPSPASRPKSSSVVFLFPSSDLRNQCRFNVFMAEAVHQQSLRVFCHRMLTFLAIGVLSANQVQWLCEGLVLDGKIDPMVSVYAKAGTDGLYPMHVRRDIWSTIHPLFKLVDEDFVELHVNLGKGQIGTCKHPVLAPAQIANSLYTKNRPAFDYLIGSDPKAFWDRVPDNDPKWSSLQDLRRIPNWKSRAIPYLLHGDTARFTHKNTCSIWSVQWKSMLTTGFAKGIFLITCVVKHTHSLKGP